MLRAGGLGHDMKKPTKPQTDYTNEAQQRLLRLVLAMFGDVVNGYSTGALAEGLGVKPPYITRDLANLQTAGLAERDEATGLWRLTPRLPQQAVKVWAAISRAETRLSDAKARYQR